MISNRLDRAKPWVGPPERSEQTGLSAFDGHRMALIIHCGDQRMVLCGKASYVRDENIGNTLNIRLDDHEPGQPVVVISEQQWNGRIIPDFHYGCDFCLDLR
jgi:hypothetical protein